MQIRTLMFAVTALSFFSCQEDMTEQKASWETTTKGWTTRFEKVKKGHDELAAKVKDFTVPENEPALVADKTALDESVKSGTTAITAAEHELASAKTTMDSLFAAGKKVPVEVAMGNVKSTVDGPLARAESMVSSANSALDTLIKKVGTAKASGEAAKSRTDAWLAEVKKKGAMLSIDDLVFAGDVLDVEHSKVALTSLIATLKSCPDLRVELNAVARGEAADLGTKRAEALKAHLTGNGVAAATLAKVAGTVVAEGDEKVSVAVTTPCK